MQLLNYHTMRSHKGKQYHITLTCGRICITRHINIAQNGYSVIRIRAFLFDCNLSSETRQFQFPHICLYCNCFVSSISRKR